MKKKPISYIASIVAFALLIFIDQYTKFLANKKLRPNGPHPIIKNVLELSYVRNTGAAWGMLAGKQFFFIALTLALVALMVVIYIRTPGDKKYRPLRIVLTTLMAGAVGNLIDRIRCNYVTDFIYFKIIDFPVFNCADIYVCVSMAVLIILIIFIYRENDFYFLSFKKKNTDTSSTTGGSNE